MRAAWVLAQLSQNFRFVDGAFPHLMHNRLRMRWSSLLRALFFQAAYMQTLQV